uniref:Uncharacterized protein n=1 Tax=Panagrolaimus sp. PS1159 TaxID=55785 RepID=A0AC35EWN2_9BILA
MSENNFSGVDLNSSKRTYDEPPPSYANIESYYPQQTNVNIEMNEQIPQRQRVIFNIAPSPSQLQQQETGVYPGTIVYTPGQEPPQSGPYIVRTMPVYIIPKSEFDQYQRRRKALIIVSLFFSISSIIVALIIIFGADSN